MPSPPPPPSPPQDLTGIPTPSTHPTGTNAAATSPTPLSVASILYIAAAFLVSSTSTLTPISLTILLVSGLNGLISGPSARINKSIPHHPKSAPNPPHQKSERGKQLTSPRPNNPQHPQHPLRQLPLPLAIHKPHPLGP